ncbi:MAG: transporter substrate-binding domain-containing protein [Kordiimonadaceae bacterium]|nr:transporter substrate-binding domain-containing protein [Kordiimonadaceae bacterium]
MAWMATQTGALAVVEKQTIKRSGLIMFVYPNLPPYAYTENGIPKGPFVEIYEYVGVSLALNFSIREYPIKRMYRKLEDGNGYVSLGIFESAIDHNKVLFGTLPIAKLHVQLYALRESALRSVWDLENTNIITVAGYTYAGLKKQLENNGKNLHFLDAQTHDGAFAMLKSGRANYMLSYKSASEKSIRALGITGITMSSIQTLPLFFIVSKKTPDAAALLSQMEIAAQMQK